MATFIGASLGDLEALAGVLDTQARALTEIQSRVGGQLGSLSWAGPDLDRFTGRWSSELSGQLDQVATLLVAAARAVRAQAEQQRVASGSPGTVGAAGTGALLGAWSTGPNLLGAAAAAGAIIAAAPPDGRGGRTSPWERLFSTETLRDGWTAFDAFKTGRETNDLVRAVRPYFAANREVTAALEAWETTRAVHARAVAGMLRLTGDPQDLRVLGAYFRGEQEVSSSLARLVPSATKYFVRRDALVGAVRMAKPWARVLGGVGVGFSLWDVVDPSHDGVRGGIDRVSGALSAGAGITALVAGASLTPPGALVVGGILAVTAAWSAGNLIYDNREHIADFGRWTAGQVADAAGWTADKAGDAAGWAGDKAGDAAGWAGDKADDAADAVSDTASHAGKAVGHKVSGAWHAAKGLF